MRRTFAPVGAPTLCRDFSFPHQIRQICDIDGDAPRFVARKLAGGFTSARLRFIVAVAQRLPVVSQTMKRLLVMLFDFT